MKPFSSVFSTANVQADIDKKKAAGWVPNATGTLIAPTSTQPAAATGLSPIITTGMETGKKQAGEVGMDYSAFKPAFAQMRALYQDRLGGYNSQQLAAQRAEQSQMINSQMLASQRQNRAGMAAQGVRGAAALAGNQNLADQAVNARGQMENALLAKQFEAQGGALANYTQFMGQERGTTMGAMYGYGNMAQTGAQQEISNDLLKKYIEAMQGKVNAGSGGGMSSTPLGGMQGSQFSDYQKMILGATPFGAQTVLASQLENLVPEQYRNRATQPVQGATGYYNENKPSWMP